MREVFGLKVICLVRVREMLEEKLEIENIRRWDTDVCQMLVLSGFKDWDWGMAGASKGGHIDLVEFLRKKRDD